jgi:hypothetical protein
MGFPIMSEAKLTMSPKVNSAKVALINSWVGSVPIDNATCAVVFPIPKPPLMASLLGVPVVKKVLDESAKNHFR